MISETHSGPHFCPSLTRVRALPTVDRGHRHLVAKAAPVDIPKLSPALSAGMQPYKSTDAPKRSTSARNRKTDNIEYRLIFAGAFAVFFVAAVFERALPTRWATAPSVKKPIVSQAKEAASISAGYAFMG